MVFSLFELRRPRSRPENFELHLVFFPAAYFLSGEEVGGNSSGRDLLPCPSLSRPDGRSAVRALITAGHGHFSRSFRKRLDALSGKEVTEPAVNNLPRVR